jgi:hypothetical protein
MPYEAPHYLSHLPTRIAWMQPHQSFTGGFIMFVKCRRVLGGDVDATEMPLQWIPAVDRSCSCRMKHHIDRANRLMHSMDNGEPRLRNEIARIEHLVVIPSQATPTESITHARAALRMAPASATRACTEGPSRKTAVVLVALICDANSMKESMAPRAMPMRWRLLRSRATSGSVWGGKVVPFRAAARSGNKNEQPARNSYQRQTRCSRCFAYLEPTRCP